MPLSLDSEQLSDDSFSSCSVFSISALVVGVASAATRVGDSPLGELSLPDVNGRIFIGGSHCGIRILT